MGHTPPGVDDRESGASMLNERHNTKYLQLIRLYSDIIRGQFFGHWHTDTFRVVYNDNGRWMHLCLSLLALANRAAVGAAVRPTDRCAASNVVQPFAICGSPSGSILSFFSLSLSPSYFRACVHIYIYIHVIFTFFCRLLSFVDLICCSLVGKVTFHFFNAFERKSKSSFYT